MNRLTLNMNNVCTSKPSTTIDKANESNNTCTTVELTVTDFIKHVIDGRTFCPAIFNGRRSNSNWIGQSVFALDFDSGVQPEVVKERCKELNIIPNVIYTTFSDSQNQRKFRLVIFTDVEIKNKDKAQMLQDTLMSLFPECDKACKDSSRMFYAAKEIVNVQSDINSIYDLAVLVNNRKSKGVEVIKVDSTYEKQPTKIDKINKSNFNFDLAIQRIEILKAFLDGQWLYHKELFGLGTNLKYINNGLDLMIETMTKHNESGKTNYGCDKFRLIKQIARSNYKSQRLSQFSQYLDDHRWNSVFEACIDK